VIFLLTGCPAPNTIHYYEGPARPIDTVALLYHNREQGIKIFKIDEKSVQNEYSLYFSESWNEIHLEPGVHTLSGGLYTDKKYSTFYLRHNFAAGKKYRVMYEAPPGTVNMRFYVHEGE